MQLADVDTSSNFKTSNPHLQNLHNLKYLPALRFTKTDLYDHLRPQGYGGSTQLTTKPAARNRPVSEGALSSAAELKLLYINESRGTLQ